MEPEIILLNEVTQTQKTNIMCFLSFVDISFDFADMFASFGISFKVWKLVRGHGGRLVGGEIEMNGI